MVGEDLAQKTLTRNGHLNHLNSVLGFERPSYRNVMTSNGESCDSSKATRLIPLLTINIGIGAAQRNRWVEHIKELLNRPAPLNIEATHADLPATKEISVAIGQIERGTAAGLNNILTKTLKPDIEVIVLVFCALFRKIWEEEPVIV